MSVLGLIPARSGSKRIPGKNLLELHGKSLLHRTIAHVNESKSIRQCLLSTDSLQYAKIARDKVVCDGLRPTDFSTDTTSDLELIKYILGSDWFRSFENVTHIAYLRPTSPIRLKGFIDDCIELALEKNCSVRSCTKIDNHLHPYWSYKVTQKGRIVPNFSAKQMVTRSQDLPVALVANGCVDVIKISEISDVFLYGDNTFPMIMEKNTFIDIDEISDVIKAEQLILRMGIN